MIRHYYHVYADGNYVDAIAEHMQALAQIDYPIEMIIGVVGESERAVDAVEFLERNRPGNVPVIGISQATAGHEHLTLDRLWAEAEDHDDAILYAHTKGASNGEQINIDWRRCMTKNTVGNWQQALYMLERGYDIAGSHWFDPSPFVAWQKPYFAGNFWWSTAEYIRSLGPVIDQAEAGPSCSCGCKPRRCRYGAENWIGTNQPRHYDFNPGPLANCKDHI